MSLPQPPAGGAPSLRRGALAATALVFAVASLAACGAGDDADTLGVKPDNAAITVGTLRVQNATVITQPDRESTGPAVISATVFNNGRSDQTLDAISLPGTTATAALKPASGSGPITVPAGGSVILGGRGNASAVLPSSREAVRDGNAQQITFVFSRTGAVKITGFVVPARSYFSKWGPSTLPQTPDAAPTGSADPSGPASASPAGAASGAPEAPSGSASEPASGE